MAIRTLQGNMYRSELANHLLMQLVVETTDDVLLLSEQYCDRDCPTWYADGVDTAAVWVVNPQKIDQKNLKQIEHEKL